MSELCSACTPIAALAWLPMADAPRDGTEVLLITRSGIVTARYEPGEWHDYPEGREYDGPVWCCYDDAFQLEIEELPDGESSEALGWLPRDALPSLDPVFHNELP